MNANSRNGYNILAALALKKPKAYEALVFKESADADLFFEFVLHSMRIDFLVPGDIFVVDKSSIHTLGGNKELQQEDECCGKKQIFSWLPYLLIILNTTQQNLFSIILLKN